MEERRAEELIRIIDRYRRSIREALETILSAEQELDAYMMKGSGVSGRNGHFGKETKRNIIRYPGGLQYDIDCGCYLDSDGTWIVNND